MDSVSAMDAGVRGFAESFDAVARVARAPLGNGSTSRSDLTKQDPSPTACSQHGDCLRCTASIACMWCFDTRGCVSTSTACPNHAGSSFQCAQPPQSNACLALADCASCTADAHCGWCARDRQCLHENDAPRCSGGWSWQPSDCNTTDCPSYHACEQCAGSNHCAWCAASQQCMYIHHTSPCAVPLARFSSDCRPSVVTQGCPANMVLVTTGNNPRCECVPGYRWEPTVRACVRDTCSGGAHWDVAQRTCVCTPPLVWQDAQRRCVNPGCVGGTVYNPQTNSCECPSARPAWNAATRRCLACPPTQSFSRGECRCPSDSIWNGRTCRCQRGAVMTQGTCTCPPSRPWMSPANRCEACTGGRVYRAGDCVCRGELQWDGRRCGCTGGASRVGTSCRCSGGRTMQAGACACDAGFAWNGSSCTCPAGAARRGGSCECTGGRALANGRCECTGGARWDGRRCGAVAAPATAATCWRCRGCEYDAWLAICHGEGNDPGGHGHNMLFNSIDDFCPQDRQRGCALAQFDYTTGVRCGLGAAACLRQFFSCCFSSNRFPIRSRGE